MRFRLLVEDLVVLARRAAEILQVLSQTALKNFGLMSRECFWQMRCRSAAFAVLLDCFAALVEIWSHTVHCPDQEPLIASRSIQPAAKTGGMSSGHNQCGWTSDLC